MEELEDKSQSNDSDVVEVAKNDQKRGCLICGEFQLVLTRYCFSLLAQLGVVLILCDQFQLHEVIDNNHNNHNNNNHNNNNHNNNNHNNT